LTQIHPTCIPPSGERQAKLTLMSESLRNDGRIWVPKAPGDQRAPQDVPDDERDYFLERMYPAYGNLAPRDIASRAAKRVCDEGRGAGALGLGVHLDFRDALASLGRGAIEERYGNLFEMYQRITGEDPYRVPMRIFPAPHYAMGGLWVDYHLMSTIPGLFVIGEANFSDHGANRLGASALMQGLADGYFVAPLTVGDYLASESLPAAAAGDAAFRDVENQVRGRIARLVALGGPRSADSFHRELGRLLWDECGMSRTAGGLARAIDQIRALRERFWQEGRVPGGAESFNRALERAGRIADYFEFAETMCLDALAREESCGAHFREEHQTSDGEAQRDDERFSHVSVWEWRGPDEPPREHREPLRFEAFAPTTRSYK
jgi:succinate dehydrogenase / fumarate reductase flavoprotein subunit